MPAAGRVREAPSGSSATSSFARDREPAQSQWFTIEADDPFPTFTQLYRPTSVLWNGSQLWALLEGHPDDVAAQAAACARWQCDGPPALPTGSRRVVAPVGDRIAHRGRSWPRSVWASCTTPNHCPRRPVPNRQ